MKILTALLFLSLSDSLHANEDLRVGRVYLPKRVENGAPASQAFLLTKGERSVLWGVAHSDSESKGKALHMLSLYYRYCAKDKAIANRLTEQAANVGFSIAVFNNAGRKFEEGIDGIREAYRWASHPTQKNDPVARDLAERCKKVLELAGQALPPPIEEKQSRK